MDTSRRATSLKNHFNQLSPSHNELIHKLTLLRFLDSKTPDGYFNRNVFNQLFQKLDTKQLPDYTTINDFIDVVILADQTLRDRIQANQDTIQQKKMIIQDCRDKLTEAQNNEKFNVYNISQDSKLGVQIFEVTPFFPGTSHIYVTLGLGNMKATTSFAPRQHPVWQNEQFDFPIVTGQEEFWVVVMDQELQAKKEIGGQAVINLASLKDQLKQDLWLDLHDKQGVVLRSKIHFSVQWIHSKIKYLEDLIGETQRDIEDLNKDNEGYWMDLDSMYEPFKSDKESEKQNYILPQANNYNENRGLSVMMRYGILGIMLYLGLTLLVSLERCVFTDIIIGCYCLMFFSSISKINGRLHVQLILLFLLLALLMEIMWLVLYTKGYTNKYGSIWYYQLEKSIHEFEIYASYLLLFCKFGLSVLFIEIYRMFPKE